MTFQKNKSFDGVRIVFSQSAMAAIKNSVDVFARVDKKSLL
jgi:hypothetical protein